MTEDIPGARAEPMVTPDEFDRGFRSMHADSLLWSLTAEAFGAEYPAEVEPFSDTTWWLLGRCISALRIGPGSVLGDLACGRGGPGLWLCRATGADLIGVDWSSEAIAAAQRRTVHFVPPGRARHVLGTFEQTGLDDESLDAAVCIDALFFATDRVAALREVRRVLRPGGRFVFTADERERAEKRSHVLDWTPLVEAAGLVVAAKEPIPGAAERWQRLYELWLAHLDDLAAEMGPDVAAEMETEARTVGPTIAGRRLLMVTAERSS